MDISTTVVTLHKPDDISDEDFAAILGCEGLHISGQVTTPLSLQTKGCGEERILDSDFVLFWLFSLVQHVLSRLSTVGQGGADQVLDGGVFRCCQVSRQPALL